MRERLLFLIEMGPQNSVLLGSQDAVSLEIGQESKKDGYVSRGIRMVRAALETVSPSLKVELKGTYAEITVKGCPEAIINSLRAY